MPIKIKKVSKNTVLSKTNCPLGSFNYISARMGFVPIDAQIVNGKYTLFYDNKIIPAMIDKYGKRTGGK